MAIYHLSVKTVSRSKGRSACAAAAYRAGDEITDQRTAEVHDYTRRRGVESAELILPADAPGWAGARAELWNAAEDAEMRKNSTVGREFEVALPSELTAEQRQQLAHIFARELVERHGCAADVAIHSPGGKGDQRNHHAHIMLTTRRLGPEGFTGKTRELDDRQKGRAEVERWRARWAELSNQALEAAGRPERVDHRSLIDQGITGRAPETKVGPSATALERRGIRTERGEQRRRSLAERQIDELLLSRPSQEAPMQAESKPDAVNASVNLSHSEKEEEQKKKNRHDYFERQARARKAAMSAGAAPAHKRQREEEKPPQRLSLDEMKRLAKRLDDAAEVIQLRDGTHAIQFKDGSIIEDQGNHLNYQGDDYRTGAQRMLELAREKGWDQIRFWGSNEWRQAAIAEAIRQGFPVTADDAHPEDKELVERLISERGAQHQQTTDTQQRAQLLERFKSEVRQEAEQQESVGPRPRM